MKEHRCDERTIIERRKSKIEKEKVHQEALKVKKMKENENLSKLEVIVSVEELKRKWI